MTTRYLRLVDGTVTEVVTDDIVTVENNPSLIDLDDGSVVIDFEGGTYQINEPSKASLVSVVNDAINLRIPEILTELQTQQKDALTDTQLRAAPLEVTGNFAVEPVALQQVADDYQTGEILPDQTGANNVLTFTFAQPVQSFWVYAVNPADETASGEVRVDPFGGSPAANLGIPVSYGGGFPVPAVTSEVKVFAATGIRVTVYGNRRA